MQKSASRIWHLDQYTDVVRQPKLIHCLTIDAAYCSKLRLVCSANLLRRDPETEHIRVRPNMGQPLCIPIFYIFIILCINLLYYYFIILKYYWHIFAQWRGKL
jgi:hypothetical protein